MEKQGITEAVDFRNAQYLGLFNDWRCALFTFTSSEAILPRVDFTICMNALPTYGGAAYADEIRARSFPRQLREPFGKISTVTFRLTSTCPPVCTALGPQIWSCLFLRRESELPNATGELLH